MQIYIFNLCFAFKVKVLSAHPKLIHLFICENIKKYTFLYNFWNKIQKQKNRLNLLIAP
jgi:hypothetical protein